MRNLLSASLFRTVRWRLFWTELGIALLLPSIILVNSYLQTNLTNAYVYKLVSQFFGHAPLVGVFVSIFASRLWGQDYEWGHFGQSCPAVMRDTRFISAISFSLLWWDWL